MRIIAPDSSQPVTFEWRQRRIGTYFGKMRGLSMEELSLGKKITRFGHCNPGFYPPIEKVLMRLPEICSQVILDDLSFEIVSFNNDSVGRYYQFASQIKSLVVLNESILNLPESEIIDAVGHEIAQKITT